MESAKEVIIDKRVFVIDEDGNLCSCKGDFYKTCPLRAANDLPCQEAVFRIMPITRAEERKIDITPEEMLEGFSQAMRGIAKGFKP
jgi:hypothetical protein